MKNKGVISKQTKDELLGIINERIYRISEELELISAEPTMHEMPSELPVYYAEAEEEKATWEKVKKYLKEIGER